MKKFLQFFMISTLLTKALYSENNNNRSGITRLSHAEIEIEEDDNELDLFSHLMQAIDRNEFNEVRNLLQNNHNNIDINHQDPQGNTLLYIAACNDNPRMVELLLHYQADPNIVHDQEPGALHASASYNNSEIIQQLLDAGANPNAIDEDGCTPLHIAIISERLGDNITSIQILLNAGANPNIAAKDGYTPLHTAVTHQKIATVQLLLEQGADRNIRTRYGRLPIDIALNEESNEIINLLQ